MRRPQNRVGIVGTNAHFVTVHRRIDVAHGIKIFFLSYARSLNRVTGSITGTQLPRAGASGPYWTGQSHRMFLSGRCVSLSDRSRPSWRNYQSFERAINKECQLDAADTLACSLPLPVSMKTSTVDFLPPCLFVATSGDSSASPEIRVIRTRISVHRYKREACRRARVNTGAAAVSW